MHGTRFLTSCGPAVGTTFKVRWPKDVEVRTGAVRRSLQQVQRRQPAAARRFFESRRNKVRSFWFPTDNRSHEAKNWSSRFLHVPKLAELAVR